MNHDQFKSIIENYLAIPADLPADVKGDIIERLSELTMRQLYIDIYDALSPEGQQTFKELSDAGQYDPLFAFLENELEDITTVVQKAADKISQEYIQARQKSEIGSI